MVNLRPALVLLAAPLVACSTASAPPPPATPARVVTTAAATTPPLAGPRCTDAAACVRAGLDAMGGADRLRAVRTQAIDRVAYTLLVEQSYRQAPFITSYRRDKVAIDMTAKKLRIASHATWPEADPGTAESDSTFVGALDWGVFRGAPDSPAGASSREATRRELELGPLAMLATAAAAPALHLAGVETVRATADDVVAFTWRGVPTRIALNPFTHLPDALATTQQFDDFWFYWGDVDRRIYFDNWRLVDGIRYPTTEVEERNGIAWESRQVLTVDFDTSFPDRWWKVDPQLVAAPVSSGWEHPYNGKPPIELAPGIEFYAGAWNMTVVVQPDGLVVLESPISGAYTDSVIDAATRRHPGLAIKAVLTTSDSWPHVGGVRAAVARKLPVYILDVNKPLLDRLVAAPHAQSPDELARAPVAADFHVISKPETIGSGDNALVVVPMRGAATERQYLVYFPHAKLLYASDTLVLNDDGSIYYPELFAEVVAAARREHLDVDRVYAMHQPPVEWQKTAALLDHAGPAPTPAAADDHMRPLRDWAGSYACAGQFANGKPIASTVRFDVDAATGAVLKHHDDTGATGGYHALEVWTYQPDAKRFAATITDSSGGVRQLYSPGLAGAALTWTNDGAPATRFVYTPLDDGNLQIDWFYADRKGNFTRGDTLTCRRSE
jgi:hypothetical protein